MYKLESLSLLSDNIVSRLWKPPYPPHPHPPTPLHWIKLQHEHIQHCLHRQSDNDLVT